MHFYKKYFLFPFKAMFAMSIVISCYTVSEDITSTDIQHFVQLAPPICPKLIIRFWVVPQIWRNPQLLHRICIGQIKKGQTMAETVGPRVCC